MNNEEVQESTTYSTRSANVIPFPTVSTVMGSTIQPVKPTQIMWYTARVYDCVPEDGKSYETGIHVTGFVNFIPDASKLNELIKNNIENKLNDPVQFLPVYFIVESYLNTSKDFY
jgi:hypothetical protein